MRSHRGIPWMLALAALLLATLLSVNAANNPRASLQKPANQQQANRLHAPTANTKLVSDSVTNLAAKIANALSNQKSKTEIFSPVSIAGALSLLLLGSGGQTQQELLNVMGLNKGQLSFQEIHISFGRLFQDLVSNDPSLEPLVTWRLNDKCNRYDEEEEEDDDFPPPPSASNPNDYTSNTVIDRTSHEISLANGIFVQRSFQLSDTYRKQSMEYYNSEVQSLNFELDPSGSTKHINQWVGEKTHGKIPNILPSTLPSSTSIVLASALYFKALWAESFIDGATKQREFYPDGKDKPPVMVEMMAHGGCFPYYESPELDARIIGLPYKQNFTTMYVIMPNDSNRAKLQRLIPKLTSENLKQMIDRMTIKTSIILFPKMHIGNTIDLRRVLHQLGVSSLFKPERSNLSAMLNEPAQTDAYVNRLQGATLSPEMRPTVNIPAYESRPAAGMSNDFKEVLIFSRVGNDTMDPTTNAPATDATEPLTTEGSVQTLVPLTNRPSSRAGRARTKRDVTYKAPSSKHAQAGPLSSKDFILHKRIVKESGPVGKKGLRRRSKRAAQQQLYVSNAVHQVDLEVNETGTEGGAATVVTLNRSGTSVVFRAETPFLLLIRNDQTNLPIFYGPVYHPSS
uniref:Serpin domain-containing protein n=1 Tax=Anopheles epiroticus TaxID=199890 RepID=A0A2C9GVF5_9DIPT